MEKSLKKVEENEKPEIKYRGVKAMPFIIGELRRKNE